MPSGPQGEQHPLDPVKPSPLILRSPVKTQRHINYYSNEIHLVGWVRRLRDSFGSPRRATSFVPDEGRAIAVSSEVLTSENTPPH